MALEIAEKSVAADGNLKIWFVPAGTGNPLSVATLELPTTKALTYSLTPTGLGRNITEERVEDPRLTKTQSFSRAGTSTETIDLQYVFGDEEEIARPTLVRGTEGTLVMRYAVANEIDATVGQLVDIVPIEAGRQRKDQPTRNGVSTITQSFNQIGDSQDDVELVA